MSTVVTENLKRATEAVARSLRGVAAAWASLNGTGTITIQDSQNTSSYTDNAAGNYTQNFTAAMGDAVYTPTFGSHGGTVANISSGMVVVGATGATPTLKTSTQLTIQVGSSANGVSADNVVYSAIHGDLA